MMKIHRSLFALALFAPSLVSGSYDVWARGGGISSHEEWNPAHLNWLPPEVRAAATRMARVCGEPLAARHLFALSMRDQTTGENFIARNVSTTMRQPVR